MNYKNILPASIVILFIMAGCTKNSIENYTQKPAVYFAAFTDKDSLVYSLAGKLMDTDTVYLAINLLGNKLDADRKFHVEVNPALTNAIEGVHYEKLKQEYVFPKGVFSMRMPVVLYKKDTALSSRYFSLALTIKSTDELDAGYPVRLGARILFTDQLIKPDYWDGYFSLYYGEYSKVKHQVCIHYQGHDFPATKAIATKPPYGPSYWMSYGRMVCTYFTNNIVNDENGNRIMPWAAF